MLTTQYLGVDASHLTQINEKHALCSETLNAFNDMQGAAQLAGIDLQLVSSYRSFEGQCAIWNGKWQGKIPIRDIHSVIIPEGSLSDTEKMHAILLWSAMPGASRHHWGSDIDVYDKAAVDAWGQPFHLVAEEYEHSGPCATLSQWLEQHAQDFGFYRPYHKYTGGIGAEPWHLSYVPLAQKIESNFEKPALLALINASDICGKDLLIEHFDEIYYRYVLNKGIPIL
ncbi:M15 family metallopeptidase [Alteromonas facilis]|uniref:M15 family metallopeptidase n=1 Tax=Alteromonas facilis TaxID=2048004 RepID=UPI000C29253C|nr:M15 family metallopeptidase [Alteromonas facilis]